MCMAVLPEGMAVYHLNAIIAFPGTGATTWVVGIEPESSGRAPHTFNHWALSPGPRNKFKVLERKLSSSSEAVL